MHTDCFLHVDLNAQALKYFTADMGTRITLNREPAAAAWCDACIR